jgi:glycosyltransferase involved in cell wall biosynthesis
VARIYFVLPVGGGSGGAHSVVQEVTAMRQLGADAAILVNEKNFATFTRTYARFELVNSACFSFTGPKDLAERISDADVVVATTNTSVHSLFEARKLTKREFRPAYYVQDYEPLFSEVGSEAWNLSLSSFNLLKDCTYFAKTHWLQDIVHAVHGHEVALVVPSIDRGIYHPVPSRRASGRRTVCAMVRPPTPRRAPHRTMRTLGRIAADFGGNVDVVAFGATPQELSDHGVGNYEGVHFLGILSQSGVADLLQQSDFFLDLSDYQAFGRTAAEAMACGTIALAPSLGGTADFIRHAENSYVVDTSDEGETYRVIEQMLSLTDGEMRQMRINGLEAVSGYTPIAAAISEFRALDMLF